MSIKISIVNETTVLSDDIVKSALRCLQHQIFSDFYPFYSTYAELEWQEKGTLPKPGNWQLIFADTSDSAGALGYHETTAHGDPIGYVFVKSDIENKCSWTVTASHELMEMLGDPNAMTAVEQDNQDGTMVFRSLELCDACEADSFGYFKPDIHGGKMSLSDGTPFLFSDFVLPQYWNPNAPTGTRLTFANNIKTPLTLLGDGYTNILTVPSTVQWGQTHGDKAANVPVKEFSRESRRLKPRGLWEKSER